jgi:hypothetical protein
MIRLLLLRLWPALLPLLVYWIWLRHIGRKATINGKPALRFRDGPWYWAVLASLLIAVVSFAILGLTQPAEKGAYTPPHMENGNIVPGQVEK